jgi:RNA polymerase sigma-70 factor (ECF subfamily)
MIENQTAQMQQWIIRHQAGDTSARDELVNCACERLLRLTRKMLKSHPGVHRWEQTDDVFQNAMIRLCRALKETKPDSVRHFFSLATLQIRRELIDLGRHYYGPAGSGAHHETESKDAESKDSRRDAFVVPDTTNEPNKLAQWCEFHEQVNALPREEREVFDLLWYQGLSQAEAASVLNISERTLQRRWQTARLKLHQALNGDLPE